jgi:hypothetical protein
VVVVPPSQAFNCWRDVRLHRPHFEREFLRKSFLSYNTLAMICQMRKQFFDHLVGIGFVSAPPGDRGGRGRGGGGGKGGVPLEFAMTHCNGTLPDV